MPSDPSYYFVVNPVSDTGRLKKKWPKIQEYIETLIPKDQFAWSFTEYVAHGTKLTKEVFAQGYNHIIAVGGDGVANEVVNAYMQLNTKDLKIGLVPGGTSNDGHNAIGLIGVNETLDRIVNGLNTVDFPIIKLTGDFGDQPHYAWVHVDCGLSALAAQSANQGSKLLKGEFKYTYHALKQLLKFKYNPAVITLDGEVYEGDFSIIAGCMHGDSMGGYKLWPDNTPDKEGMALLLARGKGKFNLLKLLLAAEKGNHLGRDGVDLLRAKTVEIELELPWVYEAEGEMFALESKSMKWEYIENALQLII